MTPITLFGYIAAVSAALPVLALMAGVAEMTFYLVRASYLAPGQPVNRQRRKES